MIAFAAAVLIVTGWVCWVHRVAHPGCAWDRCDDVWDREDRHARTGGQPWESRR